MPKKFKRAVCPLCGDEQNIYARGLCTKHYFSTIRAEKKAVAVVKKRESEEKEATQEWSLQNYLENTMPGLAE